MAARVSGMAAGGEILVSRTIKDLVAGSGIEFEDFGTHTLKGNPDEHQIFKVISAQFSIADAEMHALSFVVRPLRDTPLDVKFNRH